MYCSNCGTQNIDGVRFCAGCGKDLMPPIQNNTPRKANILCIIGFILSMSVLPMLSFYSFSNSSSTSFWLFLTASIGLTLSIIGFIQAKKRNQKCRGLGLAGIIIGGLFSVIFMYSMYTDSQVERAAREEAKYTYEETDYEGYTTRETTEETTSATTRETTTETTTEPTTTTTEENIIPSFSESKKGYTITSVGNAKTGTVTLDKGNWVNFIEAGGFGKETVEHAQAKDLTGGSIIGLFVLDIPYSLEDLTKSQMAVMEQNGGIKVTGAKVKLGGYDAYQCYCLFPDGQYLVCWYFKGNDGMIRKVTVEFTEENYYAFELVQNNYKLD